MRRAPALSESPSDSAHPGAPAFGRTLGDGGRAAAWVRVAGELDRAAAPRIAQMLGQAARRARVVVVDLRAPTRVDSLGVGTIADASRRTAKAVSKSHKEDVWAFQPASS